MCAFEGRTRHWSQPEVEFKKTGDSTTGKPLTTGHWKGQKKGRVGV